MAKSDLTSNAIKSVHPWNKGRLIGQKRPLKPKDAWAVRVRLELNGCSKDLALFNLAIDSKLRACDLVGLKIADVQAGDYRIRERATIVQKKTGRPVQFEITESTRASLAKWVGEIGTEQGSYLFPSRLKDQRHLSTRQYARLVHQWVDSAGLNSSAYGTHSMRNLRAVQLLLGHTKLESTVRYLGIEVDDALALSEQIEL